MALFPPLAIARQALLAHERALRTTGHNIANVNTPGYSRQRVDLEAIRPDAEGFGAGVRAGSQSRAVDPLIEARLRASASSLAAATSGRDLLDRVQALFPVGEGGVASALDRFFAAATTLANQPQDLAARTVLLSRGEDVAAQLRRAAGGLAALQREIDGRIVQQLGDANGALAAVADLNRAIVAAETGGGEASDLRDARDRALGRLAAVLELRVVEGERGSVDVSTAAGQALVLGTEAVTLAPNLDPSALGLDGGALTRVVIAAPGGPIGLAGAPGGALGGLLALRDGALPDGAAQLDLLATTLRGTVNAVQTDPAGRDLDMAVGAAFFGGTGAADLQVTLTDPRGIAAARSANPADNANALAFAAVGGASHAALGGLTLGSFYGAVQAGAGERARSAEDVATLEENVANALAAQRDAISGVSLEEEFTDLIRFQRGFQAAAQLITVSNHLLDDLLGLVR